MRRILISGSLIAALFLSGGRADAHSLDVTTARVSLRDGHVDVAAEVDLVTLLGGDLAGLAAAPDIELAERLAAARRAMDSSTLRIDGVVVPMVLRSFPSAAELRRAVGERSRTGADVHAAMWTMHLDAANAVAAPRTVSVSLPPIAGRVLYTFVEPQTSLASPGGDAAFVVNRVESPAHEMERGVSTRTWLAALAVALAGVALVVHFLPRRKRAVAEAR